MSDIIGLRDHRFNGRSNLRLSFLKLREKLITAVSLSYQIGKDLFRKLSAGILPYGTKNYLIVS